MAVYLSKRKRSRAQAAIGFDGWALWLFVIVAAVMLASTVLLFAAQPHVWFAADTGGCVAVEYGGTCVTPPDTYQPVWMEAHD